MGMSRTGRIVSLCLALGACSAVSATDYRPAPDSSAILQRALQAGWDEATFYQRIGEAQRQGLTHIQICSRVGRGDGYLKALNFDPGKLLGNKQDTVFIADPAQGHSAGYGVPVLNVWKSLRLRSQERDYYGCQSIAP